MLALLRRKQILEELRTKGGVRLTELSEELSVSEMTIRRDLDALQKDGLIERVHGGAVLAQYGTEEPGFEKKVLREQDEKAAIAERAAALVKPGSAVALSAGTTTCALASRLSSCEGLTVVTNSMNVWNELHHANSTGASSTGASRTGASRTGASRTGTGRTGTTVILTGGEFRTPSDALVGPTADASIRSLYFDLLFLGVHGLDPVAGLTTPNISEAETNRTFISRCRRLVVVADHTKWRTTALCTMADLSDVDTLITDEGLPEEARRQLRSHIGEVVIAPYRISDATRVAASDSL